MPGVEDDRNLSIPQKRFDFAVNAVLINEGGFSNDTNDPGGATNFGVTQHDLDEYSKELKLPSLVNNLTIDNAKTFYHAVYWEKYYYENIQSLKIAIKVFDLAVNMGPSEAHTLIQRALNWCGYRLIEDGILGPKTFAAINETCLHGREEELDTNLKEEATHYYETITEENPKLYKFLKGWLHRADE
ncbi:zliS Lysozyme family protein [uncultured Caudovirales phage]|uniref:ZliS Lysozyme family protein n=1 Tax=uncultured Caudovirales phage TaxID=2100421 RepID=A0A6J5KXD2_9CAUD|nr:zliS Lysozyme family protein [uncultured Caudovirales phage]CAB4132502.1 zliS Lysozyme family protein [uncultured Caudovirales phage]CAB4202522.1 zliS Lysozyme family protein [uncultured Caudovirales phage]CAB5207286.1 zliS Lysozyme family protein [uncultured Caudovirales phage]